MTPPAQSSLGTSRASGVKPAETNQPTVKTASMPSAMASDHPVLVSCPSSSDGGAARSVSSTSVWRRARIRRMTASTAGAMRIRRKTSTQGRSSQDAPS